MARSYDSGMNQMTLLPPAAEMERAFLNRDSSYDGIFVTGVRTTGIFCRPSCPARKPDTGHVQYFANAREALFAGFRPCLRCKPMEAPQTPPEWAQRLLAMVESAPNARFRDSDLRSQGIEPARARRYFLKHYGMTFQAYCRGRRMGSAFERIREGAVLDDVVLDSGYESFSGFREAFSQLFGRPPGKSRDSECITMSWVETPLGPMVAGATNDAICLLEFTDRRMLETQMVTIRKRFDCPIVPGENKHLQKLKEELKLYFDRKLRDFSVPLTYPGTPFQQRVWKQLLRIPYAETRSYEDLARIIGSTGAVRAVGTANGCNRIAIVIPCHRVVNKNGKLGGYGGGLWRKEFLLRLEKGSSQD
jgi:AraC family transcriptional regulator of adaptative response/methylated-DNA-[protein]-cysteine methyltransferase